VRRTSFETLLVKRTTAAERKRQQKVEEIREQEIAKMTGERAAEENQIMEKIGTIGACYMSERGG
jgi:hypothetical protein